MEPVAPLLVVALQQHLPGMFGTRIRQGSLAGGYRHRMGEQSGIHGGEVMDVHMGPHRAVGPIRACRAAEGKESRLMAGVGSGTDSSQQSRAAIRDDHRRVDAGDLHDRLLYRHRLGEERRREEAGEDGGTEKRQLHDHASRWNPHEVMIPESVTRSARDLVRRYGDGFRSTGRYPATRRAAAVC